MNRITARLTNVTLFTAALVGLHASTNGDNLLGVGASARALGGNGVAAPQDSLGAISGNPAGLSFIAGTPPSEAEVSVTFFVPHVTAAIDNLKGDSASKTYLIPSLGFSGPLGGKDGPWSYGFGLYGLAGLGVDYRNTALNTFLSTPENPNNESAGVAAARSAVRPAAALSPYPLAAGLRTELQVLEVAPSISYKIAPEWSAGLALDIDYGRLTLGGPTKGGFGVGLQPGIIFKPAQDLSFGATYTTGKTINYKEVVDFDGNGTADSLKLEAPQQFTFGTAYNWVPGRLLFAADVKWVNWSGAKGYKDFDWKDAWVYGVGVQFDAIPSKLVLRAGYTFGDNPVREHKNFVGIGAPANAQNVQGTWVNNYYYETFRIIGFPAVVEQHVSFGFSFRINETSTLDLGYTHAFENRISETGLNLFGQTTTLTSSLSEDSFELGYKYRF